MLYHCTVGKDRTGVLSALILSLLNASPEAITHDYALTRVIVEPFCEHLFKQLLPQTAPNVMPGLKPETWKSLDQPGSEAMCSVRRQNMLEFVKSMNEKWESGAELEVDDIYQGVVGYLTQELGLSVQDLRKIRAELHDRDRVGWS